MSHRIKAAKVRQTSTIERAFLLDEISKSKTKLESFRIIYFKLWSKVRQFLSYFDWIRFCRYLANIELIKQKQIRTKHFNTGVQKHGRALAPRDQKICPCDRNLQCSQKIIICRRHKIFGIAIP